jgi:hypothetical protein
MTTDPKLRFTLTSFLLGMILLNALVFWRSWWQVVAGYPDFSIFYTAGLMLRHGQGKALYNNDLQLQVQRGFATVARERNHPLPYNHPPFEAVLYIPLTYMPYLHAYGIWFLVNLVLLGGTVLLLRPHIGRLHSVFPGMAWLAGFAFFPVAYALVQGQDSIVLLLLYCLAYAALRRGRDLEAGVWLALGLFKFHLILPFIFVLLLRRRWRTILGVLLCGCLEVYISWMLVGWRELLDYPRYALEVNRHSPLHVIVPEIMGNLRGLLMGWNWAPAAASWWESALLIVSIALLLWAARQWEPADSTNLTTWNNGFSIALIATFLVSYHGYNQDMSILFLPSMLLFDRLLQARPRGWQNFALRLGLGLMFFSPLYLILTFHYSHQNLFALVLLGLAGTLAAWSSSLKAGSGGDYSQNLA